MNGPHPPAATPSPTTPSQSGVRTLLFDADGPDRHVPLEELEPARLSQRTLAWVDLRPHDITHIEDVLARLQAPALPLASLLEPRSAPVFSQQDWFAARAIAPRMSDHDAACHGEPWLLIVGPNIVVTVHESELAFLDELYCNDDPLSRVGMLDADSFAAALLDRMLTAFFDAIDNFEKHLDELEVRILEPRVRPAYLAELRTLRRSVSVLRRLLSAQRSLFDALARPDFRPEQDAAIARRFLAVSARYERVVDSVENARDLVVGSFELLATRLSQRTNESMRVLTFYTVLIGSLAVVAGVLGMNFKAPLFEAGASGFWGVVAGMVGVVLLALWAARRKGWLK
jgi:Mg2+ and Co2+ transporter CorA